MNDRIADSVNQVLRLKDRLDADVETIDVLDRRLLDRMLGEKVLSTGWSYRESGQSVVVRGEPFIQAVLPYAHCAFEPAKARCEGVDPFAVLAGAYRDFAPSNLAALGAVADSLDGASRSNDCASADYVGIGTFGLWIAAEGKNRVDLYRRLKRPIVARVCTWGYVPCDHLQLVRIRPFGVVRENGDRFIF